VQNAHNGCGTPDVCAHFESSSVEPFGDNLRRAVLLQTQLRMTMKIPSQRHHLLQAPVNLLRPL
jgi:hypothetical protein